MRAGVLRLLPGTLRARIFLILFVGLAAAYGLPACGHP